MSEAKFKTMRHIETVRNYLNQVVREFLNRQEQHDQSKLQQAEVDTFEIYTHKLRGLTYGSDEYRKCLAEMKPAIEHHYAHNRHHPEYHGTIIICETCGGKESVKDVATRDNFIEYNRCRFCQHDGPFRETGDISKMNLIDLLEMMVDWKAAGMRHDDGDLMKSIEINQKKFGYSDELARIFRNTAEWLNEQDVYHKADES